MTNSEDRAPDAIEPITAYRAWLVDDRGALWSLDRVAKWPVGRWLDAECQRRRHDAPRKRCSCGLHAARDLDRLLPYLGAAIAAGSVHTETEEVFVSEPATRSRFVATIVGKVHLAGTVIEHDFGYRSERARISEVLPVPGSDRWAQAVARRYGVPVGRPLPQETIDAATEEWLALLRSFSNHTPHEPTTEAGAPWGILLWLAVSAFCFINALRGIFMDHGPHLSEWWLWPIAMTSGLVACASLLLVVGFLPGRRAETPASSVTSEWRRPPAPIHDPRPY
jgi:hypothetical protein